LVLLFLIIIFFLIRTEALRGQHTAVLVQQAVLKPLPLAHPARAALDSPWTLRYLRRISPHLSAASRS